MEAPRATLGSLASKTEDSDTIMMESSEKSQSAKDELAIQEVPSTSAPLQSDSSMITLEAESACPAEKEPVLSVGMPKSSLKSSGSKKLCRSVTWADEKTDSSGSGNLCEVKEMGDGDGDDDALRFASAEACAMALSQAVEAVASGDSDAADAGRSLYSRSILFSCYVIDSLTNLLRFSVHRILSLFLCQFLKLELLYYHIHLMWLERNKWRVWICLNLKKLL